MATLEKAVKRKAPTDQIPRQTKNSTKDGVYSTIPKGGGKETRDYQAHAFLYPDAEEGKTTGKQEQVVPVPEFRENKDKGGQDLENNCSPNIGSNHKVPVDSKEQVMSRKIMQSVRVEFLEQFTHEQE